MFLLTDFARFPTQWRTTSGRAGEARASLTDVPPRDLIWHLSELRVADVVITHQGAAKLIALVGLFWLCPFLKKPLVSVDLILRRPQNFRQRCFAHLKKLFFQRVDLFILYFRDTVGYSRYYGIAADRCCYVPFKANIFGKTGEGGLGEKYSADYVVAAGQSLRDFDTFFEAAAQLPFPMAIAEPDFLRLAENGARFTGSVKDLPANVRVLPDNRTEEAWVNHIAGARMVVIPIVKGSLCASGIGTYLDAMVLKKPVILTRGPGAEDVLTDQVLFVPPEDPSALAQAIRQVWENPADSEAMAERGKQYAEQLGGEPELMQRILEQVVQRFAPHP